MDPEEMEAALAWLWRSVNGEGPSLAEQGYREYREAENAGLDADWAEQRRVRRNPTVAGRNAWGSLLPSDRPAGKGPHHLEQGMNAATRTQTGGSPPPKNLPQTRARPAPPAVPRARMVRELAPPPRRWRDLSREERTAYQLMRLERDDPGGDLADDLARPERGRLRH